MEPAQACRFLFAEAVLEIITQVMEGTGFAGGIALPGLARNARRDALLARRLQHAAPFGRHHARTSGPHRIDERQSG